MLTSIGTGVAQARRLCLLIRLTPFDVSTDTGRSMERYRRVALTTIASAGARGITILTSLISIPLTVGYLGPEQYGLWMTISATIAMLSFADLGMGNGLLNAVAEANGREDRVAARSYVSSAALMLSTVAGALAILFAIVYPVVPWGRIFNVSSPNALAESGPATAVFVGCFLVSLPLGVVRRVQMGYQEGFNNSMWAGAGSVLGLVGVLVAIHLEASLPWLVLAMAGAPVLTTLLNGVVLFGLKYTWLCPAWSSATLDAGLRILRMGLLFFVLQIAVSFAYSSDNIIVAQILGPEAVTDYSVPMRLFSLIPLILSMALEPLWPAYGEAISRGDTVWAKRTLMRSMAVSLAISVPTSMVLVVLGAPIIRLWVGLATIPSVSLLLGLGVWAILSCVGGVLATFLNGANIVKFQVICAASMTIAAVIAKIMLAQSNGLPGVIWGGVMTNVVFILLPTAIYMPRILSSIQTRAGLGQTVPICGSVNVQR